MSLVIAPARLQDLASAVLQFRTHVTRELIADLVVLRASEAKAHRCVCATGSGLMVDAYVLDEHLGKHPQGAFDLLGNCLASLVLLATWTNRSHHRNRLTAHGDVARGNDRKGQEVSVLPPETIGPQPWIVEEGKEPTSAEEFQATLAKYIASKYATVAKEPES